MNTAYQAPVKHQLYRTDEQKEVVLVKEVHREKKEDGSLGKILSWIVRETSLNTRNQIVLGEPYEIQASRLSPAGRVVTTPFEA